MWLIRRRIMKKIILAQHNDYNSLYAFNLGEQPFPTNGDYCIVDTRSGLKQVLFA